MSITRHRDTTEEEEHGVLGSVSDRAGYVCEVQKQKQVTDPDLEFGRVVVLLVRSQGTSRHGEQLQLDRDRMDPPRAAFEGLPHANQLTPFQDIGRQHQSIRNMQSVRSTGIPVTATNGARHADTSRQLPVPAALKSVTSETTGYVFPPVYSFPAFFT